MNISTESDPTADVADVNGQDDDSIPSPTQGTDLPEWERDPNDPELPSGATADELPSQELVGPSGPRDRAQVWVYRNRQRIVDFALGILAKNSAPEPNAGVTGKLPGPFGDVARALAGDAMKMVAETQARKLPEKIAKGLSDYSEEQILQLASEMRSLADYLEGKATH